MNNYILLVSIIWVVAATCEWAWAFAKNKEAMGWGVACAGALTFLSGVGYFYLRLALINS